MRNVHCSHQGADAPERSTSRSQWEHIVLTQLDTVYQLSYRLTGDRCDAEDLTQEVFSRIVRNDDLVRGEPPDRAVPRIAIGVFLDGVGRAHNRGIAHDTVEPPSCEIQRALNGLEPEVRAAVVLRDVTGLTYAEIADTVGMDLTTVAGWIHHGRAHLRSALEGRGVRSDGPR